jgi:hypothetical protein
MNIRAKNIPVLNLRFLRFLGVLIIVTAIPVFFWAWGEYHQHSKMLFGDSTYKMPWEVLYLNLYWISQIAIGFLFIHFGNDKSSSSTEE